MPDKYIGHVVEIVYLDSKGNITQRKIEVRSIQNQLVRATCLMTGGPRTFRMENILAWKPTGKGERRSAC